MRKVRVGMIGYGFTGIAHSRAYQDLLRYSDAEIEPVLQTIVGRDENEVRQAAGKLGWLSYETDWRRLIERDDIDIIDIAAPSGTYREIAVAAAEAGKHVICGKPLAGSKSEAEKMRKAARRAGVVHRISYPCRYAPAVLYAKKLLAEGALGETLQFRARFASGRMTGDPDHPSGWPLGRPEGEDSATLDDLLAHAVDLARHLVGEIAEVSGAEGMSGGMESADPARSRRALAALARFESGAIGVFEASSLGRDSLGASRIEIVGSKGTARLNLEQPKVLQLRLEDESTGFAGFRSIDCSEGFFPSAGAHGLSDTPATDYEQALTRLLRDFMQGIADNDCSSPNFEDGVRNLALAEAIGRSTKTRTWTRIRN